MTEPFDRWTLNFVGPINPPSNSKVYILTCTDYVTKWVEAKALENDTKQAISYFLVEDFFDRYGIPYAIVIDGSSQFTSHLI